MATAKGSIQNGTQDDMLPDGDKKRLVENIVDTVFERGAKLSQVNLKVDHDNMLSDGNEKLQSTDIVEVTMQEATTTDEVEATSLSTERGALLSQNNNAVDQGSMLSHEDDDELLAKDRMDAALQDNMVMVDNVAASRTIVSTERSGAILSQKNTPEETVVETMLPENTPPEDAAEVNRHSPMAVQMKIFSDTDVVATNISAADSAGRVAVEDTDIVFRKYRAGPTILDLSYRGSASFRELCQQLKPDFVFHGKTLVETALGKRKFAETIVITSQRPYPGGGRFVKKRGEVFTEMSKDEAIAQVLQYMRSLLEEDQAESARHDSEKHNPEERNDESSTRYGNALDENRGIEPVNDSFSSEEILMEALTRGLSRRAGLAAVREKMQVERQNTQRKTTANAATMPTNLSPASEDNQHSLTPDLVAVEQPFESVPPMAPPAEFTMPTYNSTAPSLFRQPLERKTPLQLMLEKEKAKYESEMDRFCAEMGLTAFVQQCHDGDWGRLATEYEELVADAKPYSWELQLTEAAHRAFVACQSCIPLLPLDMRQELQVIGQDRTYDESSERPPKRRRTKTSAAETLAQYRSTLSPGELFSIIPFDTLPLGSAPEYRKTACRYVLFIARKLHRERNRWFAEKALPALMGGTDKDRETVVMQLVLDAMRKIYPQEMRWSFAVGFVIGWSVKIKRPGTSFQSTCLRSPSHIRRICEHLLYFHKNIFAFLHRRGDHRGGYYEVWKNLLTSTTRLEQSFVMQKLITRLEVVREFQHCTDAYLLNLRRIISKPLPTTNGEWEHPTL